MAIQLLRPTAMAILLTQRRSLLTESDDNGCHIGNYFFEFYIFYSDTVLFIPKLSKLDLTTLHADIVRSCELTPLCRNVVRPDPFRDLVELVVRLDRWVSLDPAVHFLVRLLQNRSLRLMLLVLLLLLLLLLLLQHLLRFLLLLLM